MRKYLVLLCIGICLTTDNVSPSLIGVATNAIEMIYNSKEN